MLSNQCPNSLAWGVLTQTCFREKSAHISFCVCVYWNIVTQHSTADTNKQWVKPSCGNTKELNVQNSDLVLGSSVTAVVHLTSVYTDLDTVGCLSKALPPLWTLGLIKLFSTKANCCFSPKIETLCLSTTECKRDPVKCVYICLTNYKSKTHTNSTQHPLAGPFHAFNRISPPSSADGRCYALSKLLPPLRKIMMFDRKPRKRPGNRPWIMCVFGQTTVSSTVKKKHWDLAT